MNLEFVDELPEVKLSRAARPQQVLIDFAEALRAHPKQWAKYPKKLAASSAAATAAGINRRSGSACAALRTGEFEAASRDGVLFVRFVGVSG